MSQVLDAFLAPKTDHALKKFHPTRGLLTTDPGYLYM